MYARETSYNVPHTSMYGQCTDCIRPARHIDVNLNVPRCGWHASQCVAARASRTEERRRQRHDRTRRVILGSSDDEDGDSFMDTPNVEETNDGGVLCNIIRCSAKTKKGRVCKNGTCGYHDGKPYCYIHMNQYINLGNRINLRDACSICFEDFGTSVFDDVVRNVDVDGYGITHVNGDAANSVVNHFETSSLTKLHCGHIFHTKCIMRYRNNISITNHDKCPLCRSKSGVSRKRVRVPPDDIQSYCSEYENSIAERYGRIVTQCLSFVKGMK